MNKRGQALVEFVIILPIFLVLVLGVIDIGNILYHRTMLEGVMTDVVSLYESGHNEEEILEKIDVEHVTLEIQKNTDTVELQLLQELQMITPGFNLIFGDPYQLDVSRSIPYE